VSRSDIIEIVINTVLITGGYFAGWFTGRKHGRKEGPVKQDMVIRGFRITESVGATAKLKK
jgi:hypothetical protein